MIYFRTPCERYNIISGYKKGYYLRIVDRRDKQAPIHKRLLFESNDREGIVINRTGITIKGKDHIAGFRFIHKFLKSLKMDINELNRVK